jgi:hypothetical protein
LLAGWGPGVAHEEYFFQPRWLKKKSLSRPSDYCTLAFQCDCVKPMLYRISLDKEEIKFCTAPSDKLPIAGKEHKDKVKHQLKCPL